MNDLDLARFTPVTLEEVVDRAEMMSRVDRKYVLTSDQADALLARIDLATGVLEIDGRRQSRYESVYFDTPDLITYRMCVQQRRRRVKVRTRCYLDSGVSFLEAKTRQGDDTTVKRRIPHEGADTAHLGPEGRLYAAEALREVGLSGSLASGLRPTLVTRYRRATLLGPDGDHRVTLDTDLSWSEPGGPVTAPPRMVIVETKTTGAPSQIDRLMWGAHLRPTSISKFATGLAALRPGLPHNRWARVLRDQFTEEDLACASA